MLTTSAGGTEFSSESNSYNVASAIHLALNRLRVQLVKHRERQETLRHR